MAAYIETPEPPAWYDTARAAAYQRGYLDAIRACGLRDAVVVGPALDFCDALPCPCRGRGPCCNAVWNDEGGEL